MATAAAAVEISADAVSPHYEELLTSVSQIIA